MRSATHLVKHTDRNWKTTRILEAGVGFVLTYDGKPISRATYHELDRDDIPSWKRCHFTSIGPARRMRDEFNEQFNTDKFAITQLCLGGVIQ